MGFNDRNEYLWYLCLSCVELKLMNFFYKLMSKLVW